MHAPPTPGLIEDQCHELPKQLATTHLLSVQFALDQDAEALCLFGLLLDLPLGWNWLPHLGVEARYPHGLKPMYTTSCYQLHLKDFRWHVVVGGLVLRWVH